MLYLEAKSRHATPVLLNGRPAVLLGVLGCGEEHALVALRLLILAHAAWLSAAAAAARVSAAFHSRGGPVEAKPSGDRQGVGLTFGFNSDLAVATAGTGQATRVASKGRRLARLGVAERGIGCCTRLRSLGFHCGGRWGRGAVVMD